jgi:hypothetical protein
MRSPQPQYSHSMSGSVSVASAPAPRKSGHLYKKTGGIARSWKPRYFSLEGSVLYYYKREGDSVPRGIVVLAGCEVAPTKDKKYYSFRISHPKTSRVYDLAATLPSRTEDWVEAISAAIRHANMAESLAASALSSTASASASDLRGSMAGDFRPSMLPDSRASMADYRPSTLEFFHSSSSHSMVDYAGLAAIHVDDAQLPEQYEDRMETLMCEFVKQAQDDAEGWKLETEKRDVKAYVRKASRTGAYKGVGFINHHPHAVLKLILELSRRYTFDPQLLATQRVHVFDDHTWVDHLTYKAVFPASARDFVNITHWRVLKDGSIVVLATYDDSNEFVKPQEPQVVRARAIMAGFVLTPNEDYTGVKAVYITKADIKAGIPSSLQAKMFIKQAFVIDGLRKALEDDDSVAKGQWDRVTNRTLFGITTTDCEADEDDDTLSSSRSHSGGESGEPEPEEPAVSNGSQAVPVEGFPCVPDKYRDLVEKALARVESELNDESSWNFNSEKNGVKAYTKVDGSLTSAKGIGFLPYHPRAIWNQVIDSSKKKLVDPQLAQGMPLATLDAQTTIDYFEFKPIFVVAGRDFCNLTHWRVLPDGTIMIVAQAIEDLDLCPLKEPKVVRGEVHISCTKIVPNAAYDGAEVTFMVKTDLKGNIPSRIASKAAAEQPFVIQRIGEVLKKNRAEVERLTKLGKVTNTIFDTSAKPASSPSSTASSRSNTQTSKKESPKKVTIADKHVVVQESTAAPTTAGSDGSKPPSKHDDSSDGIVLDIPKVRHNTVNDLATYAVQFGGAILALKTVGLPSGVHLLLVLLLILYFSLQLHLGPSVMSPRRKMMIATFGPPDSGMILGTLQLDVSKTQKYIDAKREATGAHITITHIVLRALGHALSKAPSVNGHLVLGTYYPAPTVDVSCLVAVEGGKDLGVCRLPEVDKMSLTDVCNRVRGDAGKIRGGQDKGQEDRNKLMSILPTIVIRQMVNFFGWLGSAVGIRIKPLGVEPYMFGACMVTSIGMMGLDMAFAPITPYSQVPMLVTVGSIEDKAVVVHGKVVVRPILTITTTIDHRYVDGSEAARMAKNVKRLVEDPSQLEPVDSV